MEMEVNNVRVLDEKRWLMSDQGERVEKMIRDLDEKFDRFTELFFTEQGAMPSRDAKIQSVSKRVALLEKIVNQQLGAIRFGKWLIGLLGTLDLVAATKLLGLW